ncbi:SMC-Scp complex subunit ScpB [Leptothoe sp. PORK10 BA2]|uniref:SMC-Scp complex subunit ScpB n=1 Tax=Leptothoe sp. PORK10 BA2 TaxID=3110254 RepID=UPI002B1EFB39|nr:SMC-Scp complex subunit ScpB [Leptothoe sp. PORK10 BA2]MEA5466331.1 SMC-Scp complex subunit ScpB [Leptothoe sp. PORK10 BA2]
MASLSHKIEAILYLKAKPLTVGQIAEYAGCDKAAAEEGLIQLMGEYAHREGALEISETESGYSLQLRQPFRPLLDELIPLDIGLGALRTLAAIAMRGPVSQTDLVDLRGSGAYGHVHDLVDQGFVRRRRQADGRSFWLQVTEKFYQRFEIDKLPQINLPEPSDETEAAMEEMAESPDSTAESMVGSEPQLVLEPSPEVDMATAPVLILEP